MTRDYAKRVEDRSANVSKEGASFTSMGNSRLTQWKEAKDLQELDALIKLMEFGEAIRMCRDVYFRMKEEVESRKEFLEMFEEVRESTLGEVVGQLRKEGMETAAIFEMGEYRQGKVPGRGTWVVDRVRMMLQEKDEEEGNGKRALGQQGGNGRAAFIEEKVAGVDWKELHEEVAAGGGGGGTGGGRQRSRSGSRSRGRSTIKRIGWDVPPKVAWTMMPVRPVSGWQRQRDRTRPDRGMCLAEAQMMDGRSRDLMQRMPGSRKDIKVKRRRFPRDHAGQ